MKLIVVKCIYVTAVVAFKGYFGGDSAHWQHAAKKRMQSLNARHTLLL